VIDLSDGLDFDEVFQIAQWININRMLKPELHDRLLKGVNSGLSVASTLHSPQLGWLLAFLPGVGGNLGNVIDLLKLAKALLEIPAR
jgi:hypothetical protein